MSQFDGLPVEQPETIDQALSALSETPRRRILLALQEDSPRQQEAFETGKIAPGTLDDETIRIKLYHHHLPKLDEINYVDWEVETGRIRRGDDFPEVRPFLELLDDHPHKLPTSWQ